MNMLRCVLLVGWMAVAPLPAQGGADRGRLFDRVVEVLGERLFDRTFCADSLPSLAAGFRSAALAAGSPAEERAVVHALLASVPVSHLALLSTATHERLEAELMGQRTVMFGCGLLQQAGRFFVDAVYDGGPAARAGLRDGDEVLAIDGVPPGRSDRLDWRSDDAHLDDLPTHDLLAAAGDRAVFTLAGAEGARDVPVAAESYCALAASIDSVRAIECAGRSLLYVHLWFVFHGRAGRVITAALRDHPGCTGLLLDLRGRGGSALECAAIVRAVADAGEAGVPTVALLDGRTRSAKEVVAGDLQRRGLALLVGARTAGAVLPASFVAIDDRAVLMLPEQRLGAASKRLEGRGVEPDLRVEGSVPAVPGRDPILQAGQDALVDILRTPSGR